MAITIQLSDKSSYDDYVFLINSCLKYNIDSYMIDYENNVFIIFKTFEAFNPTKKKEIKICGGNFVKCGVEPVKGIKSTVIKYFSDNYTFLLNDFNCINMGILMFFYFILVSLSLKN